MGKARPARMNADISVLSLKLNITKFRRLIFVFMRFEYLVEFVLELKSGLIKVFAD